MKIMNKEVIKTIDVLIKQNLNTVFSWGFHSYQVTENNIQFEVEGFKHSGTVKLYLNKLDLFDIVLLDINGK